MNRFLRAELLHAAGRHAEALGWYESLEGRWGDPYLGISYLRRGEVYEELGDPARAVEFYNRFLKLWSDCDPELQPLVEEGRLRLKGLIDPATG